MAADKTYVGFGTKEFSDSAKLDAITKVEVFNGSVSGSYGTGGANNTLRVEFPSVQTTADAQAKAQAILAKVQGYRYQPYDARLAIVDPAAELGDGVSICGDYGGIYAQTQNLNAACRSDISAPTEEEVDNEYPFQPSQDRYIERLAGEVKATITVLDGKIALVVDDETGNIKAASIIAAINSDGSSVVIDADKINIADIEISGDQITAGTIDANVVNISNLTADFITVGSLNANRISANSWAGLNLGASGGYLTNSYIDNAFIRTLALPTSGSSQLNVRLSSNGVSVDGGANYTPWSTIIAGGGAVWG